jgi:hypothetical protein
MKRLNEAAARLKRLKPPSSVQIVSYVVGANALAAIGQHFNHFAADAITDCIGAQIVQSISLLARTNSDVLDPGSIAIQIATALVGSTLIATLPSIFAKLRQRLCTGRASIFEPGIRCWLAEEKPGRTRYE